MNIMQTLEKEEFQRLEKNIPPFAAGDTVVVASHVVEGNSRRLQSFSGVVIARRRRGLNGAFIVRRTSSGESMERTFQLASPLIESIEVLRHGRVRRAKLYYLRKRSGRSARITEKIGAKRTVKPR